MRAIIVDDEMLMIQKFVRLTKEIEDLNIVGKFDNAKDALAFCKKTSVEIAFIDVKMPQINGIALAQKLKDIREDMIIVFITAYDEYIRESNEIGGDYYIVKPYNQKVIDIMMEKVRYLAGRQSKPLYIQTFGRFLVKKDGEPIRLTGKAKEILALIVTKRGKEISNEEIYTTIWEGRPYSNAHMSVYYNALRRLRDTLEREGLENLLITTSRGQMINTNLFDCDYYSWKDKNINGENLFEGEFLSEYTWGEYILSDMLNEEWGDF